MTRKFIDQDTSQIVDDYINDLCSKQDFLCSNRKLCSENTSLFGTLDNIDKICTDIKKANTCINDVDICVVNAKNLITSSQKTINTTFLNIIVPIPNAHDELGNQKFLRLPPLSGSKIPGSNQICNSCACFERFSIAPGQQGENAKYTAPGQGECVFDDSFEYYYYPLDIENITNTLHDDPEIYLGGSRVLSKNIIFANNNEDLQSGNLYNILINNGINAPTAYSFITKKLWPENNDKKTELKLHIKNKTENELLNNDKLKFQKNMITIYVIFIIFIILVLFNLK
jgi:hypothetical protein